MTILVTAHHVIIAEAIQALLAAAGFTTSSDPACEADAVLRVLIGEKEPYPGPDEVPSLALIEADSAKEAILLATGYYACIDADRSSTVLIEAVAALGSRRRVNN